MATPQDFLNRLHIASPCPADWAAMEGDDRARFCGQCEKHVYDFSKMTAAEGMALIREKEGKVCGRLWRRADGTVITADCPVGVRRMVRRRSVLVSSGVAAVLTACFLNVGCGVRRAPMVDPSATLSPYKYTPGDPAANDDRRFVVVGDLDLQGTSSAIDILTCTQAYQMSHEDWEHLPIR